MRLIDASGAPRASHGSGCSPPLRTCCHDRRPGSRGRAIRERLGDRASSTMPGCSPGRRASARRASRRPPRGGCSPMPPGRRRLPGLETPDDHPIVKLIEAGSHPDMRWLERLPNEKRQGLARNISVDQVRALGLFLALSRHVAVAGRGDRHASTISSRRAPTPCSRCSRSRRRTASSCSSATRRAGCCRRSARAAGGSISSRSTMTP